MDLCINGRSIERRDEKKNPNVRPQMVVPSLSALLSHSPSNEPSNLRPFLYTKPVYQLHQ